MLTYEELYEKIAEMPPERRKDTVTVWDSYLGDYSPVRRTEITDHCDVLDEGHLILVCEA